MPQGLDTSTVMLQPNILVGPATVVLEDLIETENQLRSRDTLAWKKNWTESPYDFPNIYTDIPVRYLAANPISTYVDDQNNRFAQRYLKK